MNVLHNIMIIIGPFGRQRINNKHFAIKQNGHVIMPQDISSDNDRSVEITLGDFLDEVVFREVLFCWGESRVEKALALELELLFDSLGFFPFDVSHGLGVVVSALAEEVYLGVEHLLCNTF